MLVGIWCRLVWTNLARYKKGLTNVRCPILSGAARWHDISFNTPSKLDFGDSSVQSLSCWYHVLSQKHLGCVFRWVNTALIHRSSDRFVYVAAHHYIAVKKKDINKCVFTSLWSLTISPKRLHLLTIFGIKHDIRYVSSNNSLIFCANANITGVWLRDKKDLC